MANPISGKALRELRLGTEVIKVGVAAANDNLYTVYGKVAINLLYGECTAASAGASTIAINETVSNIDLVAATTTNTDAVGTIYMATGDGADTFNGGDAPTVVVGHCADNALTPYIFHAPTTGLIIEQTETGDDADLQITWHLFYIPLEDGAYVVAAA